MTCSTFGCTRTPMTSTGGFRYAMCPDCASRTLSAAFGPSVQEPRSWHELARAHRLPTSVVGGFPVTDPAPREAGERHAASPGPLPRSSVSQVAAKVA